MSALGEAVALLGSPVSLFLLLATLIVVRLRSQWGGLGVCLGWAVWVSVIAFVDTSGGRRPAAMAEGCVGSPTIFIVAVAAVCIGVVLYTAPRGSRPGTPGGS